MSKAIQPGNKQARPEAPPAVQANPDALGDIQGTVLTCAQSVFGVSIKSATGKAKEWSAEEIKLDLDALSPEAQAKVVAMLIQEGLNSIAKKAATGKVTLKNSEDESYQVDKDEAFVRKAIADRFAAFAKGDTGAKGKASAGGPVEREVLKLAKQRVRQHAKKKNLKLDDAVATKKAKSLLADNPEYHNQLRAIVTKRLDEQKKALDSIDLSGLNLEKVGTKIEKKAKKVATEADLDDA